jgi:signal transduction histidine kinase
MKTPAGPESQHNPNDGQRIATRPLSPKALKGFRLVFYLGCATSILLVILVGLVSYTALNRQEILEKWVEHTYQVLRKTDSVNTYFNQALLPNRYTSARVASDTAGLDIRERQSLFGQVHALKLLIKDNELQLQQSLLLKQQIDTLWQASHHEITASPPAGRPYRSQIAKVSATIQRIKETEEALLAGREKAYSASGKQTQVIVVAGSVLILIIVSVLIYVILKELTRRIRAYQQEHELNQLKSSFVTLASHEFRTPLSSVLLSASLIEKYLARDEKEPVIKHAAKIKQVVHNLEGILEDFLSLEKLEEGLVTAGLTSFDLTALCLEIMTAMKSVAHPGQQLSYEPSHQPEMVVLDRALVEKSLNGLLSNAIKYAGDEARIRLVTGVTAGNVEISVKDNGVGIAEEDQANLSTLFYRVHHTGHISGTGLGLNLVKRYVQLMNGTLQFSSVPHVETCFKMTFPISG